MTEEKRRFTRISFKVRARLTLEDRSIDTEGLENLSIGGCLLPVEWKVPSETPCQVEIFLEGASSSLTIRVQGKVVRSDGLKMGIHFTEIDPDSLFHLKNIARYNASDPVQVEWEIRHHPGLR